MRREIISKVDVEIPPFGSEWQDTLIEKIHDDTLSLLYNIDALLHFYINNSLKKYTGAGYTIASIAGMNFMKVFSKP